MEFKNIIFIVFVFMIMGCNENDISKELQLEEINVNFQETKIINDSVFTITFSKVLEDSRCPDNPN